MDAEGNTEATFQLVELPTPIADDNETIKEAFVALRRNIEQWVSQHIGQDLDKGKLLWTITGTCNAEGIPPMTRTFGLPDTEANVWAFRAQVHAFWSADENVFVCLWVMKLLEEQFFSQYYPTGFTMVEGHETSEARGSLERAQFNERGGCIMADLSRNLRQVTGTGICKADLIESIIKPAYALFRALQSSSTIFRFAWPRTPFRQKYNTRGPTWFTMKNIGPGQGNAAPETVSLIHDLYPALEILDDGHEVQMILVPAVILTRW